jgi:nicotinate-nucleotide pyrophosphorylase (carboxylating)
MTFYRSLISFLEEDIATGDLSTLGVSQVSPVRAKFIARQSGIVAGTKYIQKLLDIYAQMFGADNLLQTKYIPQFHDGQNVQEDQIIGEIDGDPRAILSTERTILNLVQRMSGIATATNQALEVIGKHFRLPEPFTPPQICDTRKTAPGLRLFDKEAVRFGGGKNHRQGLYQCVMLKDNHIALAGSVTEAIARARQNAGHTVKIEVEVEKKEQIDEVLSQKVDILMFDNWKPRAVYQQIANFKQKGIQVITEVSGGINAETLPAWANSGVDYISLGYLTHSVQAFDISLLFEGAVKR